MSWLYLRVSDFEKKLSKSVDKKTEFQITYPAAMAGYFFAFRKTFLTSDIEYIYIMF